MLYEQHKLPQERKQAHLHQHSSQPWQPVPQLLQWTCALIHSSLAIQTQIYVFILRNMKYKVKLFLSMFLLFSLLICSMIYQSTSHLYRFSRTLTHASCQRAGNDTVKLFLILKPFQFSKERLLQLKGHVSAHIMKLTN